MTEFDFPKDWTILLPHQKREKSGGPNAIKLYNKTRPEVMRFISEQGLVSYKLESE